MTDRETVKKTARIARLELSEAELGKFSKDMGTILDAFKKLEKAPVKGVKPSFHPVEIKNVMREDRIEPSMTQKEALSQTELKENGFVKGPKVV